MYAPDLVAQSFQEFDRASLVAFDLEIHNRLAAFQQCDSAPQDRRFRALYVQFHKFAIT